MSAVSQQAVRRFLTKVGTIINSSSFDIDKQFLLIMDRLNDNSLSEYNNRNTMLRLGYGPEDVVEEIKIIEPTECIDMQPDIKQGTNNYVFIFKKEIQNEQIYIKIKIDERKKDKIVCISFHKSKH